ncbi:VapE domain-containing protein [Klebsiella sp. GN_Kp186]|uniref:VapE domain-containing protein n=1 Tax=Klebsiella sp. GN_Kp186 TaxID=3153495 RepID=UPI0007B3D4CC|nr:VapE domain-containing protein [Klebsiella aerogenes]KZQ53565.1 replication protein [Klebsiella aerogenes]HDU5577785.1 bifunctional DNA primase/polymerase [Klebsiella aerogenes]
MADIVKRGTTPEQWDLAVTLFGRENLIPIASEGDLSPNSSLNPKSVGKVPSVHNSSGKIVGFKDWSAYRASEADIVRWKRRGYGIGLILGRDRGDGYALHALDADTASDAHQDAVYEELFRHLSVYLPYRGRDNSARRAYLVWAPPVPKHVHELPKEDGKKAAIELLGVGQQVATFGPHPSGSDYTWYDDPLLGNEYTLTPEDIPVLGAEALAAFWASLKDRLPVVDSYVAGVRRLRDLTDNDPGATDDVADWLDANGWTLSVSSDGSRNLKPFRDESEYSNGCSETSIKYFPAGTGGFQQGHFKSMHATDTGLSDTEWLDGYGYRVDDFEDLTSTEVAEPLPLPAFERDKWGRIEATISNAAKAVVRPDFVDIDIRFDQFRDEIMFAPAGSGQWQAFTDPDYARLRITMEKRGFKAVGRELIRDVVLLAADEQPFDSATTWLNGLEWDGVPRIEHFYHTHFGTADTPYTRAVSMYMWTALAGRVLEPGIKADMVPILVGRQGCGKSSGVEALSPDPAFFTEISFAEKDDDLARKMRGRLVAEIGELRGLNTKELESIKAFVTRTHENWIPKYREFATQFPRRLVFIGTTNEDEFLADKTGNRRWLPVEVSSVDVQAIKRDLLLLWAEARETFKSLGGIQFRDAERLGASVHEQYTIKDAWLETVEKWLDTPDLMTNDIPRNCEFLRASDVLRDAIGLDPRHIGKREEMRISNVLQNCGYKRETRRVEGKLMKVWRQT